MTGLDTNVLVRYLTQDDPGQAEVATRAIETAAGEDGSLFVSSIVICELVWVLETAYGYVRSQVAAVVEQILRTRQFCFEEKDLVWQSLADYRAHKGDLSDYLIGRTGARAGCQHTLTFDSGLTGSPHFKVL